VIFFVVAIFDRNGFVVVVVTKNAVVVVTADRHNNKSAVIVTRETILPRILDVWKMGCMWVVGRG
jgi:hypothetical protein